VVPIVTATTVIGVWVGRSPVAGPLVSGLVALGATLGVRIVFGRVSATRRMLAGLVIVVALVAMWRGREAWSAPVVETSERLADTVVLVGDPDPVGRGVRIVVAHDGRRLEGFAYGRSATRLRSLLAGERVRVEGLIEPLDEARRRRALVRHVVGRIRIDSVDSIRPASSTRVTEAVNRVRRLLEAGTRTLTDDDRSILSGLLYGDDRMQDSDIVDMFRRSGLAHLTAVSGQNVAYLLAALSPVLTRIRPGPRTLMVVTVLLAFVLLTRAEPSVIRASLMSGISVSSRAWGSPMSSITVLCCSVTVGVLVDPMLVWSVGWWMSVAGCAGLVVVAPLIRGDRRRSLFAELLLTTVAAQTTVAIVSVAVFGWPSAWSVPANLLAAPVAGVVMLIGLPAVLLAGVVPDGAASILCWPAVLASRWVVGVAHVGSSMASTRWFDASITVGVGLAVVGVIGMRIAPRRCGNLRTWESSSSTVPTKSSSPRKSLA
jgi:competence protein ComEC